MSLAQVAILAIVQGLTEFIPVSSSGHLFLATWLLKWPDQGLAFDIALHFGTLLAVVAYFFRDWLQVIAHGIGLDTEGNPEYRRNRGMLWLLAAGSLPIGAAGLLFKHHVETTLRSPWVIGTMLVVIGLVMEIAERTGRRQKRMDHVNLLDALVIGLAQAIAVIPGTSRSGITISAALFQNLDRATAARFSFMLSTPAIAAAAGKAFWDLHKQGGVAESMVVPMAAGVVLSAVSGALAIAFLMNYVRANSLRPFVLYRVSFGMIVLALAWYRG
jgi:undecaprenyl-diphosphatase